VSETVLLVSASSSAAARICRQRVSPQPLVRWVLLELGSSGPEEEFEGDGGGEEELAELVTSDVSSVSKV